MIEWSFPVFILWLVSSVIYSPNEIRDYVNRPCQLPPTKVSGMQGDGQRTMSMDCTLRR